MSYNMQRNSKFQLMINKINKNIQKSLNAQDRQAEFRLKDNLLANIIL